MRATIKAQALLNAVNTLASQGAQTLNLTTSPARHGAASFELADRQRVSGDGLRIGGGLGWGVAYMDVDVLRTTVAAVTGGNGTRLVSLVLIGGEETIAVSSGRNTVTLSHDECLPNGLPTRATA